MPKYTTNLSLIGPDDLVKVVELPEWYTFGLTREAAEKLAADINASRAAARRTCGFCGGPVPCLRAC